MGVQSREHSHQTLRKVLSELEYLLREMAWSNLSNLTNNNWELGECLKFVLFHYSSAFKFLLNETGLATNMGSGIFEPTHWIRNSMVFRINYKVLRRSKQIDNLSEE